MLHRPCRSLGLGKDIDTFDPQYTFMQTLTGKTALITGAGKGLGKAVALALAAEGLHLGLIGRTQKDLEEVARQAKKANAGIEVHIKVADTGIYAQVKEAVSELVGLLGSVDVLINNAGILKVGSIVELPVEEWQQVIQVNLLGAYYVIHEVFPHMLAQKKGDVINVASTAGLKGAANMSAYGASKAALINLSESLMYEGRKSNIRVTTLNPSTVATDMTVNAKFTDGNVEKVLQPEDLAQLVVYQLKLPQRAFVKEVGLWSTNP